ncbi:MAG: hypothetical protein J6A89_03310 [Clostridia bacterium]|nr:hypothetical protein [Clostridia bacterium]
MIYPQKISYKKSKKIINICLVISIAIAIMLIIINKLTTPEIKWSALANCGIIYTWITVMYSIKSGNNIAGHVLIQTILTSIVTIYIDNAIGFKGWSIYIANPIILITANSTMSILTIISYKKYIKYAIYQLIIVLISMIQIILFLRSIMELKILNNISIGISIFNLILSLVLCYKDIKDAIVRKFHM